MRFRDLARRVDSLQSRGSYAKTLSRVSLAAITGYLSLQQELIFLVALLVASVLLLTRLFRLATIILIALFVILFDPSVLLASLIAISTIVLVSPR